MRKGSLEFWPHRRAKRQLPRVRSWPVVAEPILLGTVAFKAGMTHIAMIDDSTSPSKGSEVIKPVTILEIPKVQVYGIRFYTDNGVEKNATADVYDMNLAQRLGIKKSKGDMNKAKEKISTYSDAVALAFLDASNLGFGNKRVMRFEIPVGGKDVSAKVASIEKWIGKELKITDIVKVGDYIDTTSVSKGKGWQGAVKRFGVTLQYRKATGRRRHVGTLGAWHPPKVLFTVPHAGHMGYNYRTEINKRIVKVGSANDIKEVNAKGGFANYGLVKNDYLLVEGSIPGPAKRLIRIRKALRNKAEIKAPQINYIST